MMQRCRVYAVASGHAWSCGGNGQCATAAAQFVDDGVPNEAGSCERLISDYGVRIALDMA